MFHVFRKDRLTTRTEGLVERLFANDWFTHLGEPIESEVYAVKDWEEAIELVKDPEQIFLELSGDFTVELHRLVPKRYQNWNAIVERVKKAVVPIIDERVQGLVAIDAKERAEVRDQVRWSVVHACMESEYEDTGIKGFFLPLVEWYSRGHFPCGWYGSRSGGRLAVF